MIRSALHAAHDVVRAHFADEFATILNAAGLQDRPSRVRVFRRLPTQVIRELGGPYPALGLYWDGLATQAKSQQVRDSDITVVAGYVTDATKAELEITEQQVELSVEAIMACVDRLAGTGRLLGAGEQPRTVTAQVFRERKDEKSTRPYVLRAEVRIPVRNRDTVS